MNKKLESKLDAAANLLARAENALDLDGMVAAHALINGTVKAIYAERVDVQTVLRAEQLLNSAHGNVLGKTNEARRTHEMLELQASSGRKLYAKFERNPAKYVEWADDTRENVQRGKPFSENIPFEPIRSGLTEFRNQLIADIAAPRSVDPFRERERTNRLRLEATIKAERDFLQIYIDKRRISKKEKEEQKEMTLGKFDRRIARQTQRVQLEKE